MMAVGSTELRSQYMHDNSTERTIYTSIHSVTIDAVGLSIELLHSFSDKVLAVLLIFPAKSLL
jgi:hypothetical protein